MAIFEKDEPESVEVKGYELICSNCTHISWFLG
jgi:hypothetical protein